MSEFKGSKLKVRCADCTHLNDSRCLVKDTKVSPKKKRLCNSYEFKGTYENRTPVEAVYSPYVDKKTKRALKRLLKLGIVPVSEGEIPEGFEGFQKTKTLVMPKSTAALAGKDQSTLYPEKDYAATNVILPIEGPAIDEERKEDRLIWVPGDD